MTLNSALQAVVLLAPTVPVLNLCRRRSFLRRLSLFPRALLTLFIGLVGYIVVVMIIVVYLPQLAWLAAAIVMLAAIYWYAWRARLNHGRTRNLPPGRLITAPTGPWKDYLYYLKQAEQHGSIYKMCHFVRPMVCIVGLSAGKEFLEQNDNHTVTPPMPFNDSIPGGFMRYMAPERHRAYRSRMKRIFADREFLDRHLERAIHVMRDGLRQMAESKEPVRPAPHIAEMTFVIMADLFFGVAPGDEPFERLRRGYSTIDYRRALTTTNRSVENSLGVIEKILLDNALGGDNLYSRFIGDSTTTGQFEADDPTLLRNFIFLMLTSWIDVSDLLTWVFKFMNDHPEWGSRLRQPTAAPHASENQSDENQDSQHLATSIVLETLRLEQSEYLMRRAVRDIQFRGYRIPKNWLVRICIRENHLDPDHFDQPLEFDPGRFLTRQPGQMQFAPFGLHDKSCLGTAITLWTGQQFAVEVARQTDWQVVQDGPRELGAFHWRPSLQFRVRAIPSAERAVKA